MFAHETLLVAPSALRGHDDHDKKWSSPRPAAPEVEQTPAYIYDASFDEPDAAGIILVPMPDGGKYQAAAMAKGPPGRPCLAGLYGVPLLSREQETHLFRKMNYHERERPPDSHH